MDGRVDLGEGYIIDIGHDEAGFDGTALMEAVVWLMDSSRLAGESMDIKSVKGDEVVFMDEDKQTEACLRGLMV